MNKPLRIAFDASCLATDKKAGIATYTEYLILALAEQFPHEIELIGHYCNFLGRQKFVMPQAPNIHYRSSHFMSARVLNMLRRLGIGFPFEFLTKTRADFHLFPAFIGWPSLYKTPSAPVIHDLAYLEMPETVSAVNRHDLTKLVPATLKRSIFAITPSQATRDTLRQTYGKIVPPCIVTHIPPMPMMSLEKSEALAETRGLGIPDKFILFVGTLEPRKNITQLVRAYAQLPDTLRQTYALVLAGTLGWNNQEIVSALNHALRTKLRIIHTGYVSDRQKAALYMQASLLVQPSLYEGFGMPILEAMLYHLPIIASDIPVFHEIANDAAVYADPHSTTALANSIEQVLTDKGYYSMLRQKSKQRLYRYRSWKQIAIEVYGAIVNTAKSS